MSAFTTVVGRLGELSESELRQLYLIVGVRLGKTDGETASRAGKGPSKKGPKGKGKVPKPSGGGKSAAKGNPSRKSQWETHPTYREYKRLKKVVETQAKEKNLSFAAVDTPEREAYNLALSQWLEAKSSFRDRTGQENEIEEASSSKGKAAVREGNPPRTAPKSRGNASGALAGETPVESWADEPNDPMDTQSEDSDQGSEFDDGAPEPAAAGSDGPKRKGSKASLPTRTTPPKKPSGGSKKSSKGT